MRPADASALTLARPPQVTAHGEEHTITTKVWNPTVANLSLMALGSSAPEIMLAVLDVCQTLGSPPGELGASTIVGSAAFNLFVISGALSAALLSPCSRDALSQKRRPGNPCD
jgi:Ca2+/Na+ antiporter